MQATLKAALAAITVSILAPHTTVCAQELSLTQSPAEELAHLQGTWKGVEVGHHHENGRVGDGECMLRIEGNAIRFEGANKMEWYVGTLKLPAGKNPKQLYAGITECSHPEFVGKTATAIYKREGGTLTLVGNRPGVEEPPKSFEGDQNTRTFILKRFGPEKDKLVRVSKPDLKPKLAPEGTPTVEQRFEEADAALAIAQYEKLQSAAFDIRLKLEIEPPSDQRMAEELAKKESMLRDRANKLRDETIRRDAASRR